MRKKEEEGAPTPPSQPSALSLDGVWEQCGAPAESNESPQASSVPIKTSHEAAEGGLHPFAAGSVPAQIYPTESVYKVVSQKTIPAQIGQLILDLSDEKG